MAHAGEGAPLAPNYLRLFCDHQKINGVAFHNIGGIANTAVLDKKKNIYLGFDTGPGNLLIDMAVKQFTRGKQSYDHNGQMALAGWSSINEKRLIQLLKNPFFNTPPPKSTGKEVFSEDYLNEFRSSGLQLIAETTCFTAITMALAYRKFVLPKTKLRKIYITGGGAHNHTLMRAFAQQHLPRETAELPEQEKQRQGPLYSYPCTLRWVQCAPQTAEKYCVDEILALMRVTGEEKGLARIAYDLVEEARPVRAAQGLHAKVDEPVGRVGDEEHVFAVAPQSIQKLFDVD